MNRNRMMITILACFGIISLASLSDVWKADPCYSSQHSHWQSATKRDPQLAMAFRNLGWGYYRHQRDIPEAIAHYERALALENSEAILYEELDRLYELNNSPIAARLKIFEGHNDVAKRRDDAFIRQIGVLTLAGKADKSVEYLKDKVFSYREGSSRVRETIIDAHLSLGMKYLDEQKNQEALEQFLKAQVPDEEAGSARFGNRNMQVYYFIARAYEALGQKQKATAHDELASDVDGTERTAIMSYYQGLSYQKRNDQKRARTIFEKMVAKGEQQLNPGEEKQDRFFSIFGEREADTIRKSMAYTLRGLGYKGLGDRAKAEADLAKAVELSQGNLWARTELAEMKE